jgi:hypothetical protein
MKEGSLRVYLIDRVLTGLLDSAPTIDNLGELGERLENLSRQSLKV